MAIKCIEIKNFKSFRHQKIELGQFNVLIGANASGKSNFLQIFKFISDIANHGLNNAIYRQGGVKYLRNTNIAAQDKLALKILIDSNYSDDGLINLEATSVPQITYEFSLKFNKQGLGFEVVTDKLTYQPQNQVGNFTLTHVNGKVKIENSLGDLIPRFFQDSRLIKSLKPQTLLLEQPFFRLIFAELNTVEIFNQISVYDFDTKQASSVSPIEGKIDLEEDSRNLAVILQNILADKEKKRLFFNMLTYVLPFVEDIHVESVAEKYLIIRLREAYSEVYLPTAFISDGILNTISLVIALYFDENPLLLIEEPEKNIYPYLISKLVDIFKEVSEYKQIIITTHESEVVKYADSKDILLISRDNDGFSNICRPFLEKKEVKIFLQNNLRAEYLYTQDLLGI